MVKIGLELHQRLGTRHKLFCNCAPVSNDVKKGEMQRRLHAVASELGEVDVAAKFESEKSAPFIYDEYDNGSCLVEMDDEPPGEINRDAVGIVLTLCSMTKAEIVDEIHVMRKTVVDGSNTSGFQRTAIVGLDGCIDSDGKRIGLQTIAVEEESCGIIGEMAGKTERFRLDRLGIPLVEIATDPTIASGKEARQVAERIGLIMRATGRMMRGIGTIRQDLNISTEGGARIEIKGVQSLDLIEPVIDNELSRQNSLIKLIGQVKSIRKEGLKQVDVTALFKETGSKFIRNAVARGDKVTAARFAGMKGLFGTELYKDFRYGTELSGYAKANGAGGIVHCDEDMDKYGFGKEIEKMMKSLKLKVGDGWIVIVGKEDVCRRAMDAVHKRAYLTEVPEETRRSDMEGRSHYMRPLPGAARMYPETDVKPVRITEKDIKDAAAKAVSFDDLKKEMQMILNPELADKMLRSERMDLFKELVKEGVEPTLAAVTLEDTLKTLRREGIDTTAIPEESISEMFGLYLKGKMVKAAIPELLREMAGSPKKRIAGIMKEKKLERVSGKDLEKLLKEMKAVEMGAVMAKHRLNVDPEELKKSLAQGAKGQSQKK